MRVIPVCRAQAQTDDVVDSHLRTRVERTNPQSTYNQTCFTGSSILAARRKTIASVTLQTQLDLLKSTGRYDCFKLNWHPVYDDHRFWPVPPHLFWDSDLGKWMEGAIYFLSEQFDRELDEAVRHIVDTIRSAQQEDGYLNLHYILVDPGKRWTNLRDMHEMYNAGHLLEAALAHHAHYQNGDFLDVMIKYVHLMHRTFGPGGGQLRGYPGHPELELALLRLYRATGDAKAYELARFFLEERGRGGSGNGPYPSSAQTMTTITTSEQEEDKKPKHYYDVEMELRGDEAHRRPNSYPMSRDYWYCQAHAPIREQSSVEGHAVRATYLLTAAADLVCLHAERARPLLAGPADDEAGSWLAALGRLWDSIVSRKMYLTGGVGATAQWEGFGIDHFLPQAPDEGGCYAETCASVGVMMLAERLLRLSLAGSAPGGVVAARVADVMELCLYNTVLGSITVDGQAFTYENYLASCDGHPCRREDWFECACCPPNVSRLFGSLGGYLWHFDSSSTTSSRSSNDKAQQDHQELGYEQEEDEEHASINVHLYTSARATFTTKHHNRPVTLEQKTNWPWESNILFTLRATSQVHTTIRLRVPGWSRSAYTLTPTPNPTTEPAAIDPETGYLVLSPEYLRANPSFSVSFAGLAPRLVAPHPRSGQRTWTLARGPVVYCVEDVDNPWETNHFRDVVLDGEAPVVEESRECAGEKYVALRTGGYTRVREGQWDVVGSTPFRETKGQERELVLVPYYLRANRGGRGQMRVGLLRP